LNSSRIVAIHSSYCSSEGQLTVHGPLFVHL